MRVSGDSSFATDCIRSPITFFIVLIGATGLLKFGFSELCFFVLFGLEDLFFNDIDCKLIEMVLMAKLLCEDLGIIFVSTCYNMY